MKKIYEQPAIEVVEMEAEIVMAASIIGGGSWDNAEDVEGDL